MWLDKRCRYRPAFHLRYGSLGPVPCSAAALPGTAKRPYSAVRSLPQISGQRTRVDAAPGRSNLNMRPNSASAPRHSIHEPTRKPHPPNIDRRSRRLASSRRSMCTHQSLERRRGASGMDRLALAGCHADQDIPIVGQADRGGGKQVAQAVRNQRGSSIHPARDCAVWWYQDRFLQSRFPRPAPQPRPMAV